MTTVVAIVEGDGEVAAVPILLRRIGQWLSPEQHVVVPTPLRVRRDQFLNRPDIFSRQLQLAALKCTQPGWILILLDADDDCPAQLAQTILARARAIIANRHVAVVLAKYEYESWFLAAASSLDGKRGFRRGSDSVEAESVRGAKEWLSKRMPHGKRYAEMLDQPALSACLDLEMARKNSRSFHKLCCEWEKGMLAQRARPSSPPPI